MEGDTAAEKVIRQIEKDREFVVELTQNLIRIPSVNPKFELGERINREADIQKVVASHLEAAAMMTDSYEVFPQRPNVYGYREGTDEHSLIINQRSRRRRAGG